MKRFFHGLTLFVALACMGLPGSVAWAKASAGEDFGQGASVTASRVSVTKTSRRAGRRKAHRATCRSIAKRRVIKRRAASRPSAMKVAAAKPAKAARPAAAKSAAAKSAAALSVVAPSDAYGKSLPATARIAEAVDYQLAGYTVTTDGAPARMWYSRVYTVKSPYAYVGQMKVDGRDVHVWMETIGNLLAGAVTERGADPLPDIASLMERFPDGGLGVVIANPDDFAPPSEPAVEVVEFTEPSR